MRPLSLFNGPVPMVTRAYPVVGLDKLRLTEGAFLAQFEQEITFVAGLCSVRNTPFTDRFRFGKAS